MKQVRKSAAKRTNIFLDSKLVVRVKVLAKVKTAMLIDIHSLSPESGVSHFPSSVEF
jgi:hypothetical protein